MSMFSAIHDLYQLARTHPLTKDQIGSTLVRILRWQMAVRLLKEPVIVPWVDNSRLIMQKGMVGATGNYYFGLHEFEDMAFLLHFLQEEDLFVDIGANVGSYTVLAGAVKKAHVIAVEPIPATFARLVDNISINGMSARTLAVNIGLGSNEGMLKFTNSLDAENHVATEYAVDQPCCMEISVQTLDSLLGRRCPAMIKMDVEGYETEVINGGVNVFSSPGVQALLIELNGAGARYGFDENTIRDKLERWGYRLCRYNPLTRELSELGRAQAQKHNSLYIRDPQNVELRLKAADSFKILNRQV